MNSSTPSLQHYFSKGQDFLGVHLPIICGAMSSITERNLVSSVANAGAFAVLAGGSLPPDVLMAEIQATGEMTSRPFGINLILNNKYFIEQFKVALAAKPKILVFAGSLPSNTIIHQAKDAGKKVMCFAPSLAVAGILEEQGVDALIIEGSEAGGHIGSSSTLTLIQEILFHIEKTPVFVAGGIATGEIMATCFLLGAAGVQLGSRFATSKESMAHHLFKKAYLKAKIHNTIPFTPPHPISSSHSIRCIKNKAYAEFSAVMCKLQEKLYLGEISKYQAEAEISVFWSGRLRDAAVNGNIKTGALMAGESVGLVNKIETVETIINRLVTDGESFLQNIGHKP